MNWNYTKAIAFFLNNLKWRKLNLFWALYAARNKAFNPALKIISKKGNDLALKEITHHISNKIYNKNIKEKTIIFVIHWYELGGAESFALQTLKHAKAAGFTVHVISTVTSKNSDFDKFSSIADKAIIFDSNFTIESLTNYIVNKNINILHIHHSAIAYHSLPIIKKLKPNLQVIDSLHIVEYRNGGFPMLSVQYDEYISIHNVISHSLAIYLQYTYKIIYKRNIDLKKIALTYLTPDACEFRNSINFHKKNEDGIIRLLFYGRLENQKQPYFFLKLIELLNSEKYRIKTNLSFKGVIVGDGRQLTDTLAHGDHLVQRGFLEYLGRIDDKHFVFGLSDILVITSRNEGITLTSYEAICRGIPVVSSDVGAQKELLPEEMLVNIWQFDPFTAFAEKIIDMATNQEIADRAIQKAQENLMRLSESRASYDNIVSMYYSLL